MRDLRTIPLLLLACTACGDEVSAREGAAPPAADAAPSATVIAAMGSLNGASTDLAHAALTAGMELADAAPATYVAVLFSDLDAELGARAFGIVQEVAAELGDRVREGQVLVVLDDASEQARLAAASAAADLARAEYSRAEDLLASGFVTRAQLEEATYRLRSAEAALRVAQVDVEHTRVVAPFAGVITGRMVGRGRAVREGDALFRLTALAPLRATVRVPERDAHGLGPGTPAVLLADDGARVAARVQRVSPATDPRSGTVEVLLEVPRPGALRPGSTASVILGDAAAPPRRE